MRVLSKGHLVAFFSEKFNEARHKYSIKDREFYAIVQALRYWLHYLLPTEIISYSGNQALWYEITKETRTSICRVGSKFCKSIF